jgi:transglutaminase-like putative cysteine protease
MKLQVQHITSYRYTAPASYSIQLLKLTPRRELMQRALWWRMRTPGRYVEQIDAFGNIAHLLTLEGAHSEVVLQAEGVVETDDSFNGHLPPENGLSPLVYVTPTPLTRPNGAIEALAHEVFDGQPATEPVLRRLLDRVAACVTYRPGSTQVSDAAADVIQRGEGVCQDQTHVAIAACRAAGVPARYVSGYVLSNDGSATTHAWLDAWLADQGRWLSCDVSVCALAGPSQVRLAVGRDYLDAAPVRGMRRGGGKETLDVQVSVCEAPGVPPDARRATIAQQMGQQQA